MLSSLRRSSAVALFVSFAILGFPSAGLANNSWNGYHWARTANPFTLKLGSNVSSIWSPILNTTSSDWTQSVVLNTTIVPGQANPRNCRPTSGRVEVCDSTYGNTGWLGVAQVWISGSHITQGTVKLNDTYFNTPRYNTTAWRNLVSCQEVGHTLGLDHQDTNFDNKNLGTCMDYTSDPTGGDPAYPQNCCLDNEHPNKHDYDELGIIYQHLDNSTTVGQAVPPAMNQIDLEGPAQWGRLIRQSRGGGGHASVYELDFGGGNKVFTFVIGAEPGDRD
ncbi:MAG TPA: hypothetical protein VEO37_06075 [Thermoanaerobaculia bacterium]|nr:hypothetical protein [Thermoanaerobaculia bacterium]